MASIFGERNLPREGHPIVFNHFASPLRAGYTGRRRRGQLAAIRAFQSKGQPRLGGRQLGVSPERNPCEILGLGARDGGEQGVVNGWVNFSDAVVRKTLRVISYPTRIQEFVAAVDLRRYEHLTSVSSR